MLTIYTVKIPVSKIISVFAIVLGIDIIIH